MTDLVSSKSITLQGDTCSTLSPVENRIILLIINNLIEANKGDTFPIEMSADETHLPELQSGERRMAKNFGVGKRLAIVHGPVPASLSYMPKQKSSQLDKFKGGTRELETGDSPEFFEERLRWIAKSRSAQEKA